MPFFLYFYTNKKYEKNCHDFFHGTRFTDSFDWHKTIISLISFFSELQKNKSEATLTEAYVHQALVVGLKQLFGEVS